MKRHLLTSAFVALSLALSAPTASADSFDFSYAFSGAMGHPGTVTGTLTGTQVGNSSTGYVTGVVVQSLFFNGSQLSGPIFNATFDFTVNNFTPSGSAIVSFALNQNNFLFINSDYANQNLTYSGYFYIISDPHQHDAYGDFIISDPAFFHDGANGVWSLTNTTSAVPEGGLTAVLLGFALLGLIPLRRAR